jgi:AraC-like DNA-binding protein
LAAPAEYILAYRTRRDASLLVRSDEAVKQVSRDCGFDDPNDFTKAFRKRYGASPTEFRATGMYSAR